MTSVGMTKRQMQNLAMGLVFLAVGIVVFIVLKMMEGNVVVKDGQEFVYTVDPNVYLIMLVITLVGVLIIMLTLVEYRWQSRSGVQEVNVIDLIRKKGPEPEKAAPKERTMVRPKRRPAEAAPVPVERLEPVQSPVERPVTAPEAAIVPPARPEKVTAIKVKASGRCPMCGKVILVDQKECVKCGWNVVAEQLVPIVPRTNSDV